MGDIGKPTMATVAEPRRGKRGQLPPPPPN